MKKMHKFERSLKHLERVWIRVLSVYCWRHIRQLVWGCCTCKPNICSLPVANIMTSWGHDAKRVSRLMLMAGRRREFRSSVRLLIVAVVKLPLRDRWQSSKSERSVPGRKVSDRPLDPHICPHTSLILDPHTCPHTSFLPDPHELSHVQCTSYLVK